VYPSDSVVTAFRISRRQYQISTILLFGLISTFSKSFHWNLLLEHSFNLALFHKRPPMQHRLCRLFSPTSNGRSWWCPSRCYSILFPPSLQCRFRSSFEEETSSVRLDAGRKRRDGLVLKEGVGHVTNHVGWISSSSTFHLKMPDCSQEVTGPEDDPSSAARVCIIPACSNGRAGSCPPCCHRGGCECASIRLGTA
jgi:hypothetical protein